ncbi:hypothetical protein TNCV_4236021 [Trichonephila clavipes]|nr:hypothetical protein TNCV_4236021 [Trichonephila clavipes]
MSFTRRPGSGRHRQTSHQEDRPIVRNARTQPTASWGSHEFERTRGMVTVNMERNVSRHHTELVCLNNAR